MAKSKRTSVKRPNAFLYRLALAFFRPYLYLRYKVRYDCSAKEDMSEPFVLLANHNTSADFMFAYCAMRPFKMNAVVSNYFFGSRFMSVLLRLMGCIPKTQFLPDTASVRSMRSVIMRGGSVLIFPEGEVNGYGINDIFPEGIGRLCRMLGVPVYILKISGSFLSSPKWAVSGRRGRVEAVLEPLFSRDDLIGLCDRELNERIASAIAHDESEWQLAKGIPFRGKNLAENIQSILYLCPRCGSEFTLTGTGDTVCCSACENTAVLDEYGRFHPRNPGGSVFGSVSEWVRAQRRAIENELESGTFLLEAPCFLQLHKGSKTLKHTNSGEGTVRLTEEGISYEGTMEEKTVSLCFPTDGLFKLPYDSLSDFEIPNTEETIAIAPKEKRVIAKFVQAMTVVSMRRQERFRRSASAGSLTDEIK